MAYHADNALPSHSGGERVLPMQKGGKQRLKKSDIWVTGSFDVPFLALSLLLLTIGLVMLFSASYAYAFYNDDGNSYAYISRQLIFAVVGLVAMFILSKLNYKVIQAATVPLLLVTLALLCWCWCTTQICGAFAVGSPLVPLLFSRRIWPSSPSRWCWPIISVDTTTKCASLSTALCIPFWS